MWKKKPKTKIWERLAIGVVCLFVVIAAIALAHGCFMDLVVDEMHGNDCYWCNFYRYGSSDNAAFQTRELRRSERRQR